MFCFAIMGPPTRPVFSGLTAKAVRLRRTLSNGVIRTNCDDCRSRLAPGSWSSFPYQEGAELVVGRAVARLHDFPEFEMLAMLPAPAEQG